MYRTCITWRIENTQRELRHASGDAHNILMNRMMVLKFMRHKFDNGEYDRKTDFNSAWDNAVDELREADIRDVDGTRITV